MREIHTRVAFYIGYFVGDSPIPDKRLSPASDNIMEVCRMEEFKESLKELEVRDYKAEEFVPADAQAALAPADGRLCVGFCVFLCTAFCAFFCRCANCFNCAQCANCFRCTNCFNCHRCANCQACARCR